MTNLNLLFNKTYYDCLGSGNESAWFVQQNNKLFGTVFTKEDYAESPLANLEGFAGFYMKTAYPGMLIGAGYAHDFKTDDDSANESIKIGFSFDYTNGLPYIPGSSVKGVLRSMFREKEVLSELLAACIGKEAADSVDADALENDIFEDGRDTFLDAVLIAGDKNGKILGEDYITPHEKETKNPVPIKMIKILPDVFFEFRFILKDSVDGQGNVILSAAQKKELFGALLEISGAGAKTNVGYGVLIPEDKRPEIAQPSGKESKSSQKAEEKKPSRSVGTVKKKKGCMLHVGLADGNTVQINEKNVDIANTDTDSLTGKTVSLETRIIGGKERLFIVGVVG